MSFGPASAFFAIAPTPHGGRGVFATQHIPKDTLILTCESPYASVIHRKFRKEVCAWCFAWSLEVARKSSWSISKTNGPNAGVWFCRESCRNAWISAGEGVPGGDHAGVRGILNATLERCLMTMEKDKAKSRTRSGVELGWAAFLLDSKVIPIFPTMLTEFELDTARFVLAGLLKKCTDDFSQKESTGTRRINCTTYPSGDWADVLDLQDNALEHIQAKPYMLASQIRIWVFIRFVVYSILRESKRLSDRTRHLVYLLKKSVDTPLETRVLLGREHGNVFGIWDMALEEMNSEMLGWGLYSFGSYFNHDCSPTLRKEHKGRAIEYYAIKDIDTGEELCISYVETDQVVEKRKEALKEWFFDCGCGTCVAELV
ncbi:hypothetical protein AGABI2DRAFT_211045 [Agaricus bisporus var. bisporus H97]|uniref:hypothetical protein n=1 Tax=Agaricus bisporus var. bisporus (strain H97 / ATCC MYA-4626 / FGSC 10389) TaxID=936046 RepID=UPI00029F7EEF|nr:hypothetical protein AGABI2DRAFT_211045 [Agaricus bisporus var. bisporus H97]EKV43209.1 hypothetical protein AGABI2DRAFT_211045 [Agaricus bisporus var. bisporus H97]